MAFHLTRTWYNGYRCSCCQHTSSSDWWVDTIEEALAELPTEFPPENDGGYISVTVKDGSTGKEVASSKVSFAPVWQRGDGYKFTGWSLYIDEEAAPGRGTYIHQIIEGTNHQPREGEMVQGDDGPGGEDTPAPKNPLKLITDRDWSQLCDALGEAKKARDIAKAEADKADAEKRLNALRGSVSERPA